MIYYILYSFILILIIFSTFLILLNNKIKKLENNIIKLFCNRTDTIPSLFEATKNNLIKHDNVFKIALILRKEEFTKIDNNLDLFNILQTENKIHKELNFILKLSKSHNSLLKNNKFLYIREIIINKSHEIGKNINLYKKIIIKYNKFVSIKNWTILGLLIPIYKKAEL